MGILLNQYNQSLINENIGSLTGINLENITMQINSPLNSQLNGEVTFYEANTILLAFAYRFTTYNYFVGQNDPSLLDFTRTFAFPFSDMYYDIGTKLYENIFNEYNSIFTDLDLIMALGIVLTTSLIIAFFPIFWKYEKMEKMAILKLCGVTAKELEPSLKKND
jgi:hypothetical protein